MEGQTSRLEGSNAGAGGGVGPIELFIRARWMGVLAGLDVARPLLGGVECLNRLDRLCGLVVDYLCDLLRRILGL